MAFWSYDRAVMCFYCCMKLAVGRLLWDACCGMLAVWRLLWDACCVTLAVWRLLLDVCCVILAVGCLLCDVCCGTRFIGCLLCQANANFVTLMITVWRLLYLSCCVTLAVGHLLWDACYGMLVVCGFLWDFPRLLMSATNFVILYPRFVLVCIFPACWLVWLVLLSSIHVLCHTLLYTCLTISLIEYIWWIGTYFPVCSQLWVYLLLLVLVFRDACCRTLMLSVGFLLCHAFVGRLLWYFDAFVGRLMWYADACFETLGV